MQGESGYYSDIALRTEKCCHNKESYDTLSSKERINDGMRTEDQAKISYM